MLNELSELIFTLEKYPVSVTVLVAFLGVLGVVMAQIVMHINAEYDKKVERVTDYIGSLRLQVLSTHDRLALLRERRIDKVLIQGKTNSIAYIDGRMRTCYADISSDLVSADWCYRSGFNLCSACYLIACLIAQCYRTKQHLEILHLKKRKLNKLTNYLLSLEGIFDENFGIWQISQYDIALFMLDEKGSLISYHKFCMLAGKEHCFLQLFDFYLSIANYGRRTQELDLLILLYEFYYFLEDLVYPSLFQKLSHVLFYCLFRKHPLFFTRKKMSLEEAGMHKASPSEIGPENTTLPESLTPPESLPLPVPPSPSEKNEKEKALELKYYLYTEYPKNRMGREKNRKKNSYKKLFMPYYEIAVQPISNYIIMKGIEE